VSTSGEIEAWEPEAGGDAASTALAQHLGNGAIEAPMQAYVITALR
jgi:hypothetical protein